MPDYFSYYECLIVVYMQDCLCCVDGEDECFLIFSINSKMFQSLTKSYMQALFFGGCSLADYDLLSLVLVLK